MANIRQVKDDANQVFYPQTHEKAVIDSNGVSLQAKLASITTPTYVTAWDGASTPVVANIPAGIVVTYNETDYTGTLVASASTQNKIYLVSNGDEEYDRYYTNKNGDVYSWLGLGSTAIGLSDYYTKSEISQIVEPIFTTDAKMELVSILRKIPYIVSNAGEDIDLLESLLLSGATLISLSAVFTQGQNPVYPGDSLDSLRTYLTVTGLYSDETAREIQGYTLSGTLVVGTSTITVSYSGKTTTFNVTVIERMIYSLENGTLSTKEGAIFAMAGDYNAMNLTTSKRKAVVSAYEQGVAMINTGGSTITPPVYPIKIPVNATKATLEFAPSTLYGEIAVLFLDEGHYYRNLAKSGSTWEVSAGPSAQPVVMELGTLAGRSDMYLGVSLKVGSAGTSDVPSSQPTSCTITFE